MTDLVMWKSLGLLCRKVVGYCRQSLTSCLVGTQKTEMLRIYVDCRGLAPETSEGNNTNQARDFSCDIVAKKNWLLSALILRTCLRLNLKVMTHLFGEDFKRA